jgi:UDP-glucose 4-epimerase
VATYLVTGGCGFIGSHLADALVGAGHGVRIVDDLSTGRRANAPPAAELIVADIAEPEVAADAMAGVDGCFHLAAIASVARSNEDWLGTHRANLTATIAVFEAARRGGDGAPVPVVYASSAAVYGDNPEMPLAEDAVPCPLTAYGADKLGCEHHARVATLVHGVATLGCRFFNVYGPRQDPHSPYSGVISIFAERALAGAGLAIHGDGAQTRDFIFVADVVRFLVTAMARMPGAAPVFNVCTGHAVSVNALARMIVEAAGSAATITHVAPRTGDIARSIGDPARAGAALGFTAATAIADGLAPTLAAIRAEAG